MFFSVLFWGFWLQKTNEVKRSFQVMWTEAAEASQDEPNPGLFGSDPFLVLSLIPFLPLA